MNWPANLQSSSGNLTVIHNVDMENTWPYKSLDSLFFYGKQEPSSLCIDDGLSILKRGVGCCFGSNSSELGLLCLPEQGYESGNAKYTEPPFRRFPPWWHFCVGALFVWYGRFVMYRRNGWRYLLIVVILGEAGTGLFLTGATNHRIEQQSEYCQTLQHNAKIVPLIRTLPREREKFSTRLRSPQGPSPG